MYITRKLPNDEIEKWLQVNYYTVLLVDHSTLTSEWSIGQSGMTKVAAPSYGMAQTPLRGQFVEKKNNDNSVVSHMKHKILLMSIYYI